MLRLGLSGFVTAVLLALMVKASAVPLPAGGEDRGVLRLAWSVRPERIETCRPQSEDELARLPVHMRQPLVCEGASAQYRLTVRLGEETLVDQVLRGGGLRHDRRLYVFREFRLAPGEVHVDVRFERVEPEETAAAAGAPPIISRPSAGEAVPPRLAFREEVRVQPGEVVLVTYSAEGRALVSRRRER